MVHGSIHNCVFQARDQAHKHEVRSMELGAQQEKLEAMRAVEESTRHAKDAARDAQEALHEVNYCSYTIEFRIIYP